MVQNVGLSPRLLKMNKRQVSGDELEIVTID
jgi:hypothetical protein